MATQMDEYSRLTDSHALSSSLATLLGQGLQPQPPRPRASTVGDDEGPDLIDLDSDYEHGGKPEAGDDGPMPSILRTSPDRYR